MKDELQKEYLKQNTAKMTFKGAAGRSPADTAEGYERIRAEANRDGLPDRGDQGADQEKESCCLHSPRRKRRRRRSRSVLPTGRAGAGREEEQRSV